MRLFQLFSTHWRFVFILCEFFVNFIDFCEFVEVLWIFLDFLACSWLGLDFYVSFLGFLAIVEIDFRSLIKIFWNFGFSYVLQRFFLEYLGFYKKFVTYSYKLLLLSDFFSCFRHIEDLFWFCASFLWILKIYLNFERSYGSFWTLWNVLDLVWVFMYLFWSFGYCRH